MVILDVAGHKPANWEGRGCVGKRGFTESKILSCFCRHECKTQTRGGFGFDLVK